MVLCHDWKLDKPQFHAVCLKRGSKAVAQNVDKSRTMDRMTDERLAVLEKELMRTPLQPHQQKAIELLQALKADRKRVAELEAESFEIAKGAVEQEQEYRARELRGIKLLEEKDKRIVELGAELYVQSLAKHQAYETIQRWETKCAELEAQLKECDEELRGHLEGEGLIALEQGDEQ
jgi:hypothetical protein